jgi:N-acylneuraminate cytidylyltransferase
VSHAATSPAANDSALPSLIALIPARGGSKRVPRKNIRPLAGHPVLAYTIAAARASGVFVDVLVSTEDEEIAGIARHYGATVLPRPASMAADASPDIDWVAHALQSRADTGPMPDCFAILRPSSPFRTADTIRRARSQFMADPSVDSLRAVEKCKQHPAKMWVVEEQGTRMRPLLTGGPVDPPWHSSPYDSLPVVYVQNASLEIAWSRVVLETHTIAGTTIMPFFTQGHEGMDINHPEDWRMAEELVVSGAAVLPEIPHSPLPMNTPAMASR